MFIPKGQSYIRYTLYILLKSSFLFLNNSFFRIKDNTIQIRSTFMTFRIYQINQIIQNLKIKILSISVLNFFFKKFSSCCLHMIKSQSQYFISFINPYQYKTISCSFNFRPYRYRCMTKTYLNISSYFIPFFKINLSL